MGNRMSITQERLKELLDYDPETGVFLWKEKRGSAAAGSRAGCLDHHGHRLIRVDRNLYRAGRLAWLHVHGELPEEVDHRNRIRDDDRLKNLRPSTRPQNCQNTGKHRDNTSGHKGVFWVKREKRWMVQIRANGKTHYLGHFDEKSRAVTAAREAYEQLHGEFACAA
jgi:hypothetical protein